ncbi:beta-ketoacyl synthase [Streptomyces sp. AV19]|uniref:type I polyketide synthase n=1 Tax=Streptomyces sp. AV19 TaxID=2793068 RepID=UPI0018FE6C81|nr:beta-ketoacyl synthase N-terminal-like domain-containing protein [Streptomyces sp. AV19]MBH1934187.1 beta-ketoacyl synthase [Streptomyces sp. AV19]MDG4533550.1 phosphopantetheine-binding protein [Streptomyces sp. AV19]
MTDCDVAIIGMACRFPGAPSVGAFWDLLREGRETVRFLTDGELPAAGADPAGQTRPGFVRAAQTIEGVELFDAAHFGIPEDEAEILDPQHRHFLQCALAALEDAGYDPGTHPGEIGVFAGAGMNTYLPGNLADRYATGSTLGRYRLMLANDKDYLATRVCYKLDLRGPGVTVGTACSTSLVAVHLACLSLLAGECGMALAGAVHLRMPQDEGHLYQEGMIFSPDGHCRAFDAAARGTVLGSGVGVVLLKRLDEALADGDTVHAVVKGTAVTNDGSAKTGFTAPGVERQAATVREAQRVAGCPPGTIGYVEAHGTGTPLGDPVEVAALNRAFGPTGEGRTVLGSVKTNIGHLDAAAGMAGLIKTALMLRHRTLVPSLHFRTPNPDIDFAAGPFRVGTETVPWPDGDGPRRAGVSSFGVGGTNAHVVLEEPPAAAPAPGPRPAEPLLVSARTPEALARATGDLARHLRRRPGLELDAVTHTLAAGRRHHVHRRAVVCADTRDAALSLAILDPGRVWTGRADQRPDGFALVLPDTAGTPGAAELYAEQADFKEAVDACAEPAGTGPAALLADRATAAFVVPYALARVCRAWGVAPAAVVGWGTGRTVAGRLAGVLGSYDAHALCAGRPVVPACAAPRIPVSLGARWLRPDEAADPATWTRPGTREADRSRAEALLKEEGLVPLVLDLSDGSAAEVLLTALARAWTHGADVRWERWYGPGRRRRVPLPTYPYEPRRHWIEPPSRRTSTDAPDDLRRRVEEAGPAERSGILQEFLRHQAARLLEPEDGRLPGVDDDLGRFGADSLVLIDIVAILGTALGRDLTSSFDDPPTLRGLADQVAASWRKG